MSQEKHSFVERLFGGSYHDEREEKVLQYIIHRVRDGAELEEVVEEEYVRRNLSQVEMDAVTSDPELVHEARERLELAFESDELRPDPPSR